MTGGTTSFSKEKVIDLRELELQMAATDKLIIATEESKNALEEYVYDVRGKLEMDYGEFMDEKVQCSFLDVESSAVLSR
jgi:hypothetical protein